MMQAMRNPKIYKWGLYGLLVLTIPAFVLFYGNPGTMGGGSRPQFADIDNAVTVRTETGTRNLPLSFVRDAERELLNQYAAAWTLLTGIPPQQAQMAQISAVVGLEDAARFAVGKAAFDELARRSGLVVSRQQVEDLLRTENVSAQQWQAMVRNSGLSERGFLAAIQGDLQRERIRGLVSNSARVSLLESWLQHRLQNDELTVDFVRIDAAAFEDQVEVSDEEVRDFFEANGTRYMRPEKAVFEYIIVRPPAAPTPDPSEEELLAFYESIDPDAEPAFAQEAALQVRHIKIGMEDDEILTEDEARERAEQARARIVEGGEDFALVANQLSTDLLNLGAPGAEGPAFMGGQVDRPVGERNRAFLEQSYGEAWFEAASALSVGEISPVVQSGPAFFVIEATEAIEAGKRPFESVRNLVRQRVVQRERGAAEESRREAHAEQRTRLRLAREEIATLAAIAEEMGVELQRTEPLDSQNRVFELIDSVGNLFEFREYVNSLRRGMISDVLPASGPEGLRPLVVMEVVELDPRRPMTFEEARDQAERDLRRERALALARAAAEELRAAAEEAVVLADAAEELGRQIVAVTQPFPRFQPPPELAPVRTPLIQQTFQRPEGSIAVLPIATRQPTAADPNRQVETGFVVLQILTLDQPDQFEFVETMADIEDQLREGKSLSFLEEFRRDALVRMEPRFSEQVFPR